MTAGLGRQLDRRAEEQRQAVAELTTDLDRVKGELERSR